MAQRSSPTCMWQTSRSQGFYTEYLGLTTEEFNLGWVARYTCPQSGINVHW